MGKKYSIAAIIYYGLLALSIAGLASSVITGFLLDDWDTSFIGKSVAIIFSLSIGREFGKEEGRGT